MYQHVFGEVTPMFCHRGIESVGFGYSVQSFSLVVHISPVLCLACERVTEREEEREGDEEGREAERGGESVRERREEHTTVNLV